MANGPIGYDFLADALGTGAFAQKRPAMVKPVTKVTDMHGLLAVPAAVAPKSNDPIEHLQFALKHEGLNLQAAILALKRIDAQCVAREFLKSPSSGYARVVAYLWELANNKALEGLGAASGVYVPLFDPDAFITGPVQRNPRWRVDFNGLGNPGYCPSVQKTAEVVQLLDADILGQATAFIASLDKGILDRAVRWAYLSETDGSYAIERESPTHDKTEAFASLLAQANRRERLTEEYLVALQNLAVTNPIDRGVQFRNKQNWLANGLPGAIGLTYLPPPPDALMEIMDGVMAIANDEAAIAHVDPLVRGALVSFGFVFAHPFMDGNGRLSRFLFHKVVCSTGRLPDGLVLPVSVAMKRDEAGYLAALESFSKEARARWSVLAIGDGDYATTFHGDAAMYRYWDATECVSFGLRMAQQALAHDLRNESDFLRKFDKVYRAVNSAIDMNNNDLVILIRSSLQNAGTLSANRKKQMIAKGHKAELLDAMQAIITEVLAQ